MRRLTSSIRLQYLPMSGSGGLLAAICIPQPSRIGSSATLITMADRYCTCNSRLTEHFKPSQERDDRNGSVNFLTNKKAHRGCNFDRTAFVFYSLALLVKHHTA